MTHSRDSELLLTIIAIIPCHYRNAALSSKLANYQEQVAMLNKELELYQKLLHESYQVSGSSGQGGEGLGNTTEKVLQLLEDIRRLRRQLDQSIRRNSALSETLDIPVSDSSTSPRRVRSVLTCIPHISTTILTV